MSSYWFRYFIILVPGRTDTEAAGAAVSVSILSNKAPMWVAESVASVREAGAMPVPPCRRKWSIHDPTGVAVRVEGPVSACKK